MTDTTDLIARLDAEATQCASEGLMDAAMLLHEAAQALAASHADAAAPAPAVQAVAPDEQHRAAADHAHELLRRMGYHRDGEFVINVNRVGAEAMHVTTIATIVHAALLGAAAAPVAPVEIGRNALRAGQAAAVMPLIGPLLDAWECCSQACREELPELDKHLRQINRAMEDAEAEPPPAAAPVAPQAAPADDEFTVTAREALAWVLWHHLGGSSPVGQPIRFALGMGQHERMSEIQIEGAKRWARATGSATEEFHRAKAAPVAQPLTPLTAEQVAQTIVDAGYDMTTANERADFINGIRHGERAHGITAAGQEGGAS